MYTLVANFQVLDRSVDLSHRSTAVAAGLLLSAPRAGDIDY